jgi:hypothetical protein
MKLVCFDLDDTLCHTIKPEEGKPIWKEKTGEDWPHRGWWSKPESLDLDIFDIKVNPYVYEEYLKAVSDPNNYVICATGRVEKLRPEVEKLLSEKNLAFDAIYLNTGGDTFNFKCRLFERLIRKLGVSEFTMYDDRELHLIEFKKWAKTIDCRITIIDVKNKTKKVFK